MTANTNIILQGLNELEQRHQVRILFAIEAGSRAWGFASPDSDYDVRFVYAHSVDWYLSITDKRDVIEWMPDKLFDYAGWDIRKALQLFSDSNPSLLEGLQSKIVYRDHSIIAELRNITASAHSRKTLAWHYFRMAQKNWQKYVAGKELVRLKKYLYVIRPLITILWLKEHDGLPPIRIQQIMEEIYLPSEFLHEVAIFLDRKSCTSEMGESAPIAVIDHWIKGSFALAQDYCDTAATNRPGSEALDSMLKRIIIGIHDSPNPGTVKRYTM